MDERRDDWRHGVDENLASLNAGQRVWDRDIRQIRKSLSDIDALLRGDPAEDTDGVMARVHALETDIRLLRAAVLDDAAGNMGLQGRVSKLEGGEKSSENRWKFATAVVVAILSLLGLLLTNWDRLAAFLEPHGKVDPLERAIESAKHPKNRYHHYTVHVEPPSEDQE